MRSRVASIGADGDALIDAIRGGDRDHKTVPEIVSMIENASKKS